MQCVQLERAAIDSPLNVWHHEILVETKSSPVEILSTFLICNSIKQDSIIDRLLLFSEKKGFRTLRTSLLFLGSRKANGQWVVKVVKYLRLLTYFGIRAKVRAESGFLVGFASSAASFFLRKIRLINFKSNKRDGKVTSIQSEVGGGLNLGVLEGAKMLLRVNCFAAMNYSRPGKWHRRQSGQVTSRLLFETKQNRKKNADTEIGSLISFSSAVYPPKAIVAVQKKKLFLCAVINK